MSKFKDFGKKITDAVLPGIYGDGGLAEMLDCLGEQVTENEESLYKVMEILEPSYGGPSSALEELHDELTSKDSALDQDIDELTQIVEMLASAVHINQKSLQSRISDLEQGLTVLYAQVQPKEITLSDLLATEEIDKAHEEALCYQDLVPVKFETRRSPFTGKSYQAPSEA